LTVTGVQTCALPIFQLSEEQRINGVQPGGSAVLRPGRDSYLITGDLNILHAELKARYIISDTINYLTYVYDVSPGDKNPPEYERSEERRVGKGGERG